MLVLSVKAKAKQNVSLWCDEVYGVLGRDVVDCEKDVVDCEKKRWKQRSIDIAATRPVNVSRGLDNPRREHVNTLK